MCFHLQPLDVTQKLSLFEEGNSNLNLVATSGGRLGNPLKDRHTNLIGRVFRRVTVSERQKQSLNSSVCEVKVASEVKLQGHIFYRVKCVIRGFIVRSCG